MGMDTVEIVLDTEERFGISLPDEDCMKVFTVDDFFQLVCSRMNHAGLNRCLTASTFYRLRTGMAQKLGIHKRTLNPDTHLDDLLEIRGREKTWEEISRDLDLKFPGLIRRPALSYGICGIAVFSILIPMGFWAAGVWDSWMFFTAAVLGALLTYLLLSFTEPLKQYFDTGMRTLGDLTKSVVALNFSRLSGDSGGWSKSDVYSTLLEIISFNLGVPVVEIKPHHRFVDDLGAE